MDLAFGSLTVSLYPKPSEWHFTLNLGSVTTPSKLVIEYSFWTQAAVSIHPGRLTLRSDLSLFILGNGSCVWNPGNGFPCLALASGSSHSNFVLKTSLFCAVFLPSGTHTVIPALKPWVSDHVSTAMASGTLSVCLPPHPWAVAPYFQLRHCSNSIIWNLGSCPL